MVADEVSPEADSSFTLEIPVTEAAPREARARLARGGADWKLDDDQWDTLLLIVSEALANAARRSHAVPEDERAVIHLRASGGGVRGEVRNGRLGFDVPLARFLTDGVAESLYVIDRVSDAWGLDFSGGARLWFELHPRGGGSAVEVRA